MQNRALIPLLFAGSLLAGPCLGQEAKLPLGLGYYVEDGESCAQADEASIAHLHKDGLDTRFGSCTFESLSDGGEGRWDYTASCEGEALGTFATQGQITVKSETAFNVANGEQEVDYSFCPQDQLPARYRAP